MFAINISFLVGMITNQEQLIGSAVPDITYSANILHTNVKFHNVKYNNIINKQCQVMKEVKNSHCF